MRVNYQLVGAGVDGAGAFLLLQHSGGSVRLPVGHDVAKEAVGHIGARVGVSFDLEAGRAVGS